MRARSSRGFCGPACAWSRRRGSPLRRRSCSAEGSTARASPFGAVARGCVAAMRVPGRTHGGNASGSGDDRGRLERGIERDLPDRAVRVRRQADLQRDAPRRGGGLGESARGGPVRHQAAEALAVPRDDLVELLDRAFRVQRPRRPREWPGRGQAAQRLEGRYAGREQPTVRERKADRRETLLLGKRVE